MKRMLLIGALTVGASLTTAQAAEAKGYISAIRVCGPSGCATVHHPRAAMQRFGMDMLSDAGRHAERPPLLPYYRLRFLPSYEVPNSDAFYIPGAKVICTDGGCIHVRRGLVPALSAAAANVGAFTPRISSVTVGGRPRADRARFAILFNQRPAPLPSTVVWKSRHYSVIAKFGEITPWSLGGGELDGVLPAVSRPEPGRALVPRRRRCRPARPGPGGRRGARERPQLVRCRRGGGRARRRRRRGPQAAEAEVRLIRGGGRPCPVPPPPT